MIRFTVLHVCYNSFNIFCDSFCHPRTLDSIHFHSASGRNVDHRSVFRRDSYLSYSRTSDRLTVYHHAYCLSYRHNVDYHLCDRVYHDFFYRCRSLCCLNNTTFCQNVLRSVTVISSTSKYGSVVLIDSRCCSLQFSVMNSP